MNYSLQQLINDKESELTKIRTLANEAALQREHEAKEEAQRMENEMAKIRRDCDDTIQRVTQQIEDEAKDKLHHARKEMEVYLELRQKEIYADASEQMEKQWQDREDTLKMEVQLMLDSELDRQQKTLTAHYDSVIHSKECDIKLIKEDMTRKVEAAEKRHQAELDSMKQKMDEDAKEIWSESREQYATAVEEKVTRSLAIKASQCKDLEDENSELRRSLNEKERIIKQSIIEMQDMEYTFQDVAREVNRVHAKEMTDISDHISRLAQDNDHLKHTTNEMANENNHLKDELDRYKTMNRSLESKCKDQMKMIEAVDVTKSESTSRISELTACNELLNRQMSDVNSGHTALVAANEKQRLIIDDLTSENAKQATTIDDLQKTNQKIEDKCDTLTQDLSNVQQQVSSLEQERQSYTTQTNHLLERNDKHYTEKIRDYEQKLADAQNEAFSIGKKAQDNLNTLSVECNQLRSRILQLQRDNFRLEQDLMYSHRPKPQLNAHEDEVKDTRPQSPSKETQELEDENKALKEIIAMMRESVESAVAEESSDEPSKESILERQLALCQSYLDLLLNPSNKSSRRHDELSFLRTKNQELLQIIDQLRQESVENTSNRQNRGDLPSIQEQQLISRLEEATDEIDALLTERNQLMKLSNELKFQLEQANEKSSTCQISNESEKAPCAQEEEGAGEMLDEILNDFSASCDGESHEEPDAVACIGMKLPTGTTSDVSASCIRPQFIYIIVHVYL